MIIGLQVLQEIEAAADEPRNQESQVNDTLRSTSDELARLQVERNGLLRQFAQMCLDLIQRGSLVGDLDAAECQATELIGEARKAFEQLAVFESEATLRWSLRCNV